MEYEIVKMMHVSGSYTRNILVIYEPETEQFYGRYRYFIPVIGNNLEDTTIMEISEQTIRESFERIM